MSFLTAIFIILSTCCIFKCIAMYCYLTVYVCIVCQFAKTNHGKFFRYTVYVCIPHRAVRYEIFPMSYVMGIYVTI